MSMKTRAVIVFGASGFIGRTFVDAFKGSVESIYAVTGRGGLVPGADLTVPMSELARLPELPKETVVVHAAAARYRAASFRADQDAILDANVRIANAVFEFCAARALTELRLISSVAVYPASSAVLDDEIAVDLNAWPHEGEASYAWSKRWAEIGADIQRRRRGLNTLTFRLTNPYGPYDSTDDASAHVVAAFVIRALGPGASFQIMGDPAAQRDFLFSRDAGATLLASLDRRGENEVFNLAYGQTFSIRDLAAAALRAAGADKEIVVAPSNAGGGVSIRRATGAKLRRAFDLPAFADLDAGLSITADWYRRELGL